MHDKKAIAVMMLCCMFFLLANSALYSGEQKVVAFLELSKNLESFLDADLQKTSTPQQKSAAPKPDQPKKAVEIVGKPLEILSQWRNELADKKNFTEFLTSAVEVLHELQKIGQASLDSAKLQDHFSAAFSDWLKQYQQARQAHEKVLGSLSEDELKKKFSQCKETYLQEDLEGIETKDQSVGARHTVTAWGNVILEQEEGQPSAKKPGDLDLD